MSCSFNYLLSDPRDRSCLGMAGAGALSRVHVGAEGLSIAACDQSNAFTRVKVPGWMVPYLATPPVVAEAVWDLLPSDLRESIAPTTMVSPCYNRLPMGCSHSVHILMSINMQSIGMTLRSSLKLGSPNVRGEGTLEEAQSSQSSVGNPVENPQPDTYLVGGLSDPADEAEPDIFYGCSDDVCWERFQQGSGGRQEAGYSVDEWWKAIRQARDSDDLRTIVVMNFFCW